MSADGDMVQNLSELLNYAGCVPPVSSNCSMQDWFRSWIFLWLATIGFNSPVVYLCSYQAFCFLPDYWAMSIPFSPHVSKCLHCGHRQVECAFGFLASKLYSQK